MSTTEDILERIVSLQQASSEAFMRLETEVRELKDQRYKPYFASAGAFVVVVMGVMSYVYALETRLNAVLFEINASVQVSHERNNVLEDRLIARTESIHVRWETHSREHSRISDGFSLLLQHMMHTGQLESGDLGNLEID